jgi:NADPH-dependent 2,4-dienoyl-CoA reductase/sulfur reductase-like enzyme
MSVGNTANPIVIVGGGLAGGSAAATLREESFAGRIVLVGREPGIPFGRPPLSKTYLRSEEDLDQWYVKSPGWYEEYDVERIVGSSVVAVDPVAHSVVLDISNESSHQIALPASSYRRSCADQRACQRWRSHHVVTPKAPFTRPIGKSDHCADEGWGRCCSVAGRDPLTWRLLLAPGSRGAPLVRPTGAPPTTRHPGATRTRTLSPEYGRYQRQAPAVCRVQVAGTPARDLRRR